LDFSSEKQEITAFRILAFFHSDNTSEILNIESLLLIEDFLFGLFLSMILFEFCKLFKSLWGFNSDYFKESKKIIWDF